MSSHAKPTKTAMNVNWMCEISHHTWKSDKIHILPDILPNFTFQQIDSICHTSCSTWKCLQGYLWDTKCLNIDISPEIKYGINIHNSYWLWICKKYTSGKKLNLYLMWHFASLFSRIPRMELSMDQPKIWNSSTIQNL